MIRQQESFITLLENWDKYESLLATSRNSKGTAETKYNAYRDSLEASQNRLTATIEEFTNRAELSNLLKVLTDISTTLAKGLPFLIKWLPIIFTQLQNLKILSGRSILQRLFTGDKFMNFARGIGADASYNYNNALARGYGKFRAGLSGLYGALFGHYDPNTGKSKRGFTHFDPATGQYVYEEQPTTPVLTPRDKARLAARQAKEQARLDKQAMKEQARLAKKQEKADKQPGKKQKRDEERQAKAEKRAAAKEEKRAAAAQAKLNKSYFKEEIAQKKNLYKLTEQGQKVEESILSKRKLAEAVSNNVLKKEEAREMISTQMVSDAQIERMQKAGILSDAEAEALKKHEVLSNAQAEAAISGTTTTGGGGAPAAKVAKGAKKVKGVKGESGVGGIQAYQAGMAAASYAINQITAGISAYNTFGVSHKNQWDEEVQSSEAAHQQGRTIAMAWTMAVPYLGSFIGEYFANKTMKEIDQGRDAINKTASNANKSLEVLNNVSGDLKTMADLASSTDPNDIKEREEAARAYALEMYKPENSELRHSLQTYLAQLVEQGEESLRNQYSLNDLMNEYTSDDKNKRERAIRLLQIAQKRSELQQKEAARASEAYEWEQRLGKAKLNYNAAAKPGYTDRGISKSASSGAGWAGFGAGVGTGVGVAAGAAVAGTAMVALFSAAGIAAMAGPVGWIVGAIAAVGGTIAGLIVGLQTAEAKRMEAEEKEKAEREWNSKTTQQKIETLSNQSTKIKDAINYAEMSEEERASWRAANEDKGVAYLDEIKNLSDTGVDTLGKQLSATEEFIDVLYDYKEYLQEIVREKNELKVEEALLTAEDEKGNALIDLSIEQLKAFNLTDIYRMMAEAVGEDNLIGIETYQKVYNNTTGAFENKVDENGNLVLTEAFIDAVTKTLRSDSDINAVLNGEAYTLSDALKYLSPTDQLENKILQNFAAALGTTVENLGEYEEKFGKLKLNELLQTTTEINTEIGEYSSLMSELSESSGSMSEVLNKIIKQFPDLIVYMNDVPTLMTKIMQKVRQLSDQYNQTRWEELAASEEFFQDEENGIRKDILSYITGKYDASKSAEVDELMRANGITSMAKLRTWLAGQTSTKNDEGEFVFSDSNAQALYEAFQKAGSAYTITSDVYKEALSQYIDYQTTLLDKQIENLTQQRSALEEINKQREYENKLIEARIALESAQNEKKRIYRAGVGWVYEADQGAIDQAQKGLEEVEKEQDLSRLTMQIETLSSYKDDWSNIWEKQNFELAEQQAKAFEEQFNIEGGLNAGFDGLNSTMGEVRQSVDNLLGGIEEPLTAITNKVLTSDEENKQKTISNLQGLWDQYQKALESGDVKAADNALKAYSNAYDAASDIVGNWTPENNALRDNGAATNANKATANKAAAEGDTSGKAYYGDNAVTVGKNGYDKYHDYGSLGWRLTGNGQTYTLGNYEAQRGVSSGDAVSIMEDMRRAQSGESGTEQNDAHIWWKTTSGAVQDADFGSGDLPSVLRQTDADTSLEAYAKRVNETYPEVIIGGLYGEREWAYLKDHGAWAISEVNDPRTNNKSTVWYDALAKGTLDAGSGKNGLALINELGTEALVTPDGTLTALPSHSGVLPADITKNLWALGGVAPSILRALQMNILPNGIGGTAQPSVVDESFTVNSLTMNVNADSTFDARQFVNSLKQQMALRRNLK